jgi:hypothetical protein
MTESTRRLIAETAFAEQAHLNIKKNQEQVELIYESSNNLSRAIKAEKKLKEVEKDLDYFKSKLHTYKTEQELMAEWMVSQKAFKELAIRFGFEKKLSKEEVIQMAEEKMEDVLDNKNPPDHRTNASDDPFIEKRKEIVRTKIKPRNSADK